MIAERLALSAHDVSEGGVFTALLESGFNRALGFAVNSNPAVRKDAWFLEKRKAG
jgi:phosphoribosylformylglycinamidine synthase